MKRRIFIGVQPPSHFQKRLKKLLAKLEKKHWPVKWETPEKLHFTLAFLGWLEKEKVKLVREVVGNICLEISRFKVEIKGLGCFPDYQQPRVIWLGLKGDLKGLAGLQKQLAEELRGRGFRIDQRPFAAHLTLGRIKQARFRQKKEIGRQLKGMQQLEISGGWLVDQVTIFESILGRSGSRYRSIKVVKLKK